MGPPFCRGMMRHRFIIDWHQFIQWPLIYLMTDMAPVHEAVTVGLRMAKLNVFILLRSLKDNHRLSNMIVVVWYCPPERFGVLQNATQVYIVYNTRQIL